MLTSAQLSIDRAKLVGQLDEIIEVRDDDPAKETILAKRGVLHGQLMETNDKIVAALETEDLEAQAAMARGTNQDGWTPELREFHQLGQRTSIVEYMQAGVQQRHLRPDTPEHEYNSHVFGGNWNVGDYPLEMLLDRSEYFDLEARQAEQVQEPELEQRTAITGVVVDGRESVLR